MQWLETLIVAWGLEPDDLWGPFQAKPFFDTVILWLWKQDIQDSSELVNKIGFEN